MTGPILVDTDVLIDFFRGHRRAVTFIDTHADRIIMSSIVIAELYAGVKGSAEQTILENFISIFRVVPVSAGIARDGALYKRDYGKSHSVGLADAILAATAKAENAKMATLNTKHYPMLKHLAPAYKK